MGRTASEARELDMLSKRVKPYDDSEEGASLAAAGTKPSAKEAADAAKLKELEKGAPFLSLFREADGMDKALMLFGIVGAIITGMCLPVFTILFSETIDSFGKHVGTPKMEDEVNKYTLYMTLLGVVAFVASLCMMWFWQWAGMRQASRLRVRYLAASLSQNIEFFDIDSSSGTLLQGLSEDTLKIQAAIGDKCANFISTVSTGLTGISLGLYHAWDVALVMAAMIPVLGLFLFIMDKTGTRANAKADQAYSEANEIATEAVANVRTVMAFNAQPKIVRRYASALNRTVANGVRTSITYGAGIGLLFLCIYSAYSLAFWYGAGRVRDGKYDGADILSTVFSFLVGAMALAQSAPNIPAFGRGRTAGARVFRVLDKTPAFTGACQATLQAAGLQPRATRRSLAAQNAKDANVELSKLEGALELQNVGFAYPTRPDQMVFDDFCLKCEPGTTTALVGASGSGKSTAVSLLVRFYDPTHGRVLIDGVDLRSLSLSWYRSHIGLVSQEPTLFAMTIAENIECGAPAGKTPTREDVIAAAKAANAHNFISRLPEGYDTVVGERGGQLSGGQRQRIGIARAILRAPQILLLDEATSALDTTSEALVQSALDRLKQGRTTVVVAHRLSTVQDADAIAVVRSGAVVEIGTHNELLENETGAYRTLVELQLAAMDEATPSGTPLTSPTAANQSTAFSIKTAADVGTELEAEELKELVAPTPSSDLKGNKGKQTKDKPLTKAPMGRLLRMNRPELPYFMVGMVFSIASGIIMPAFALIMSEIIAVFYEEDKDEAKSGAAFWSLMFLALGVVFFVSTLGQQYCFGVMGHRLAQRVRVLLMRSVLNQEAAFFDSDEHSAGSVATCLSEDTVLVRGAVGDALGAMVQSCTTLAAGIILAFVYSWKMAAVVLATMPFLIVSAILQQKVMLHMGDGSDNSKNWAAATSTASEAIRSIRTVQAFGLEGRVVQLYASHAAEREKSSRLSAFFAGLAFGASQFIMFATYSLSFWFGAKQVADHGLSYDDMLTALFGIVFAAFGAAQAQISFPDVAKAPPAAARIFDIVNNEPSINAHDEGGDRLPDVQGRLALDGVNFAYPTRKEAPVFKNFNLEMKPGQTVALVGESGSGKSTIVSLSERLYDPDGGVVLLDGTDIKGFNVNWLRDQLGLVSQEPALLSSTILENILLGMPEGTALSVAEEAARVANAYEFIDAMPERFATRVGEGGVQLSGGQKQRIAIARAVVRAPRLLLLDEATSALDAASEKAVQEALEKVSADRSTIIVAHRLSTIRNVDSIAVVQDGKILEQGTHEELIERAGAYKKLIVAQLGSRSGADLTTMSSKE